MTKSLPDNDWLNSVHLQILSWILLVCYCLVLILSGLGAGPGNFDDAIPLVGADLINHGRVPQVDFHSVYPALLLYLMAGAFRVFGRTILVARMIHSVFLIAVLAAAWRFFRVQTTWVRPLAPLLTLSVAVVIGSFAFESGWPACALIFVALLIWFSARSRSPLVPLFTGFVLAVSSLIRFNFWFYAFLALMADLAAREILSPDPIRVRVRRLVTSGALLCAPLLLANAVFYFWVYRTDAIPVLHRSLISGTAAIQSRFMVVNPGLRAVVLLCWPSGWFALRIFSRTGRFSRPFFLASASGLALAALVFAFSGNPSISIWVPPVALVTVIALHLKICPITRFEFGLLACYVCLWHYYLARVDGLHAHPLIVIISLMAPFLTVGASGVIVPQGTKSIPRWFMLSLFFVPALLVLSEAAHFGPQLAGARDGYQAIRAGFRSPHDTRGDYPDEQKAVDLVRTMTSPSEAIFVGVQDHSRVFVNDVRIYWLSNRLPGSQYLQLDAGVASLESVQRSIIADLEKSHVNWVVLEEAARAGDPSFLRRVRADSTVLDTYFSDLFREETHFGHFSVRQRILRSQYPPDAPSSP